MQPENTTQAWVQMSNCQSPRSNATPPLRRHPIPKTAHRPTKKAPTISDQDSFLKADSFPASYRISSARLGCLNPYGESRNMAIIKERFLACSVEACSFYPLAHVQLSPEPRRGGNMSAQSERDLGVLAPNRV